MVREDLIEGAVTFLQDPSVSSSPVEQKIAFLRSKNLTQEEIDVSLARVGQPSSNQTPPPSSSNYSQQYRPPPQQQYGYGGYQQPWGQPPPEPPRRDWRDWFIMATVVGGASYAMYWTAKRYIYPLIAPPTPPQLEQDKANVDASFDKAFALLDQLATDTQELKDSEKARKERLDNALNDVESVVTKMRSATETQEMGTKRMAKEISDIRQQIPEAIKREKEATDERLKDLIAEMKSVRALMDSRMGPPSAQAAPVGSAGSSNRGAGAGTSEAFAHYRDQVRQLEDMRPGSANRNSATADVPVNGTTPAAAEQSEQVNGTVERPRPLPGATPRERARPERTSESKAAQMRMLGNGKPQIPAWQLAAKQKAEEVADQVSSEIPGVSVPGITDSGTVTEDEPAA